MFSLLRQRFSYSALLSLRPGCRQNLPLHPGRLFGSLPLTPLQSVEAKLTVQKREVSVRWMRICKIADRCGSIQKSSENITLVIVWFLILPATSNIQVGRRMNFHPLKLFRSNLQRGKLNKTIKMPRLMRHWWGIQHSSSTLISSDGRLTSHAVYHNATNETLTYLQKDHADKVLCSFLNVTTLMWWGYCMTIMKEPRQFGGKVHASRQAVGFSSS